MTSRFGAVATVVSRIDDPVVATALQQADCVNQHTPGEQVRPLAHDFHMRMVELAGNPILSLFLRIVVALWERHSAHPALQTSDSAAIAAEVSHADHHISRRHPRQRPAAGPAPYESAPRSARQLVGITTPTIGDQPRCLGTAERFVTWLVSCCHIVDFRARL